MVVVRTNPTHSRPHTLSLRPLTRVRVPIPSPILWILIEWSTLPKLRNTGRSRVRRNNQQHTPTGKRYTAHAYLQFTRRPTRPLCQPAQNPKLQNVYGPNDVFTATIKVDTSDVSCGDRLRMHMNLVREFTMSERASERVCVRAPALLLYVLSVSTHIGRIMVGQRVVTTRVRSHHRDIDDRARVRWAQ